MIRIRRATEKRQRDKKRNRFALEIGAKSWHVTADEARQMRRQITRMLSKITTLLLIPWWFSLACEHAQAVNLSPEITRLADSAAVRYRLDPCMVKAIIVCESAGNPEAVSKCGATGLMQLMPSTWAWVVKDVLKQNTPWGFSCATDAECNIEIGCAYLRWLFDHWGKRDCNGMGLRECVIASYNAGQGCVGKARGDIERLPKETQKYLFRVVQEMGRISRGVQK